MLLVLQSKTLETFFFNFTDEKASKNQGGQVGKRGVKENIQTKVTVLAIFQSIHLHLPAFKHTAIVTTTRRKQKNFAWGK